MKTFLTDLMARAFARPSPNTEQFDAGFRDGERASRGTLMGCRGGHDKVVLAMPRRGADYRRGYHAGLQNKHGTRLHGIDTGAALA